MSFDPVVNESAPNAAPGGHSCTGHALARALLSALAAVLVSACGSTPQRSADTAATPPPPSVVSKPGPRGGGYYKDDGPDAVTPDNLEAIPDAEPRLEPLHRFANRPYNVFGQGYVPATELRPFRDRGRASWYGRRFHGKPTSSGEPYDMYAMTAAHPTLPIPSYVRVTHSGNGRSVVLRVNDRGPFHKGRIIDLSYTAAYKLGYINSGSAEVEVEQIVPDELPLLAAAKPVPPMPGRRLPASVEQSQLAPAPVAATDAPWVPETTAARVLAPLVRPAPSVAVEADQASAASAAEGLVPHIASASAGIFLQLGAFASLANAEGFKAAVEQDVVEHAERIELFADGERFRLHAGPYDTVDAARAAAVRLGTTLKLKPFVVTR